MICKPGFFAGCFRHRSGTPVEPWGNAARVVKEFCGLGQNLVHLNGIKVHRVFMTGWACRITVSPVVGVRRNEVIEGERIRLALQSTGLGIMPLKH